MHCLDGFLIPGVLILASKAIVKVAQTQAYRARVRLAPALTFITALTLTLTLSANNKMPLTV